MRLIVKMIMVGICAFIVVPAMARSENDLAFRLCISQPLLQSKNLIPLWEEKLAGVHDPALDGYTVSQLVNYEQWTIGNQCADALDAHPDVLSAVFDLQAKSEEEDTLWTAFNVWCKSDLTGDCIRKEVGAQDDIVSENAALDHGVTPWNQGCLFLLSSHATPWQEKRCMDLVHEVNPVRKDVLICASKTGWHSIDDGDVAGRGIVECLKKRSVAR